MTTEEWGRPDLEEIKLSKIFGHPMCMMRRGDDLNDIMDRATKLGFCPKVISEKLIAFAKQSDDGDWDGTLHLWFRNHEERREEAAKLITRVYVAFDWALHIGNRDILKPLIFKSISHRYRWMREIGDREEVLSLIKDQEEALFLIKETTLYGRNWLNLDEVESLIKTWDIKVKNLRPSIREGMRDWIKRQKNDSK